VLFTCALGLALARSAAAAEGGTLAAPPPPPADAAPPPAVTTPPPPASPKPHKKKRKQEQRRRAFERPFLGFLPLPKPPKLGHVEAQGRVFVRGELERHYVAVVDPVGATRVQKVNALDLSIPTARAGLLYQAPVRWLSANVELELTGKPELKDAWLKGHFRYLTAKAGQFKMPFSTLEMESVWSLPTASRGLLHDVLVHELQVGGRRPGVALEVHSRGPIRPSLTLGTFQGSVLVDDDPDTRKVSLLAEQSTASQSLVARAELQVQDLVFGLDYESRMGTPALLSTKRYATGGADMTLDTDVGGLGVRIWLEGMVGASWLENWYKPPDGRDATFWAGRLVSAVRSGGQQRGDYYVEPYGMLGLFDPDAGVSQDIASEEVVGVNVGLWKLARVGLQAELEHVERNFPQTYYLGDDPDRLAVVLQAGAQF